MAHTLKLSRAKRLVLFTLLVGAIRRRVLLFEVGLESTVRDMVKGGTAVIFVAVPGVAVPFALGWGVGVLLLADRSVYVHAFLGATLTATRVGITARVLQDLGRSKSAEARVILGAAVIDDVLGLAILAVVGGVIAAADRGASLSSGEIALVLGKAVAFLFRCSRAGRVSAATGVQRRIPFAWSWCAVGNGVDLLIRLGLPRCRRRPGALVFPFM